MWRSLVRKAWRVVCWSVEWMDSFGAYDVLARQIAAVSLSGSRVYVRVVGALGEV